MPARKRNRTRPTPAPTPPPAAPAAAPTSEAPAPPQPGRQPQHQQRHQNGRTKCRYCSAENAYVYCTTKTSRYYRCRKCSYKFKLAR